VDDGLLAHLVRIRVLRVINPARQGLVLRVTAEVAAIGARRPILVGEVTPYPPGKPTEFVLPLPPEAATAIMQAQSSHLLVRLVTPSSMPLVPEIYLRARVLLTSA
jgi:hypothetical protein